MIWTRLRVCAALCLFAGTGLLHGFNGPGGASPCADAETGIAACTGTAPHGSAIETATLGTKAFTVQARDNAGSTTFQQVVDTIAKASTTTTLAATTPNPSSAFGVVRLTATVAGVANVTPTGLVHFFDGATLLGSAAVNGYQIAAISTTALAAGTHSLTATYVGDASFDGSTSAAIAHTVHPLATSTITALIVSPTPSPAGAPVSLFAIVAPLGGTDAPGGTVEFFGGHNSFGRPLLGTAPLLPLSGYRVATLPVSGLATGLHVLEARYAGDGTFGGSTSPTTLHSVYEITPAATTTTLMTTPNPSASGQSFSLTIEVRSPDGVPFGNVYLSINGWIQPTLWLTASGGVGRVTVPVGGLPRGLYVMSAMYLPFGPFAASSSQNIYHCVGCSLTPAVQSLPPVR